MERWNTEACRTIASKEQVHYVIAIKILGGNREWKYSDKSCQREYGTI